MSRSEGLIYLERITPTLKNAIAIQRLTLEDAILGGFEKPRRLANPASISKLFRQWQRLLRDPENYSGYELDGQLVGFIKQNYANAADRVPSHKDEPDNEWAIFGLVASHVLFEDDQETVLVGLLVRTFEDRSTGEPQAVNVAIHERDPLLHIALDYGFVPVGELAEVPGAPGLEQQYYRRPASK